MYKYPQPFSPDDTVDLTNFAVSEVIVTITRQSRMKPMKITVQILGCFEEVTETTPYSSVTTSQGMHLTLYYIFFR